ncbi:MAG: ATP-binding protein, partial [Clostridiaceae bacterium]|nr:ATP-binding protein [Clostridiaceae bacterium]
MYYRPRVVDSILEDRLDSKGAVLIEGAKWCGKTTTASQIARSRIHMQDPAMKQQNLRMAELHPQLLLEGDTPRLIDEWQLAPQLWDAVRFEVDRRGAFGQFILTGSSTPVESELISHSGTGRIARLLLRPMSLYESDESNGKISLKSLFESEEIVCTSDKTILDYAFFICRGGWPLSLGQKESVALRQAIDYVDSVVESDISLGEGIPRDPTRVRALMRSYARHVSTRAKTTTIQNDILASLSTMDINTLDRYLNDLRR